MTCRRPLCSPGLLCVVAVVAGLLMSSVAVQAQEDVPLGTTAAPWVNPYSSPLLGSRAVDDAWLQPNGRPWVTGGIVTRFQDRQSETDRDQDWDSFLDLELGTPGETWVSGRFSARTTSDLDGRENGNDQTLTTIPDPDDAFGHPTRYVMGLAYLQFDDRDEHTGVRLGRQEVTDVVGPTFDGATLYYRPWRRWQFDVLGGVPWNAYTPNREDDYIVGSVITFATGDGFKMQAEYLFMGSRNEADEYHRDNRLEFRGWYSNPLGFAKWSFAFADGQFEGFNLLLRGQINNKLNLDFTLGWTWQRMGSLQRVAEWSRFYYIMGHVQAHHLLTGGLSWTSPDARTAVDLSFTLRLLTNPDNENPLNREYLQTLLTVSRERLFGVKGLSAEVFGTWIYAHDRHEMATAGGEIAIATPEYERHRTRWAMRLAVGSGYDVYRIDGLTAQYRDYIRSIYGRYSLYLAPRVPLDTRFAWENSDGEDYLRLEVSLSWFF